MTTLSKVSSRILEGMPKLAACLEVLERHGVMVIGCEMGVTREPLVFVHNNKDLQAFVAGFADQVLHYGWDKANRLTGKRKKLYKALFAGCKIEWLESE